MTLGKGLADRGTVAVHSLTRVGNAVLGRTERGRGVRVLSQPTSLTLHVTDRCSLRCVMCMNASGSALDWPKEGMHQPSRDFSRDSLDELLTRFPSARYVCFAGVGEPLLNRELASMVSLARERGLRSTLITNGTEIVDNLDWLTNGSLHAVEVSVNAVDKESMARDCRGTSASLARLSEGLAKLVREKARRGSPHHLSLSAVLWRSRLPDAHKFIDFAASHRIPALAFHNLIPSSLTGCGPEEVLDCSAVERLGELASHGRRVGVAVAVPVVLRLGSSIDGERAHCTSPWRTLYVDADGGVSGCFRIESPSRANGDWRQPHVWNNQYFRSLRGTHMGTGGELPARCLSCVETAAR
jgi:MoaA/NifB/PqqE/SkfB family radical SAM enzyme